MAPAVPESPSANGRARAGAASLPARRRTWDWPLALPGLPGLRGRFSPVSEQTAGKRWRTHARDSRIALPCPLTGSADVSTTQDPGLSGTVAPDSPRQGAVKRPVIALLFTQSGMSLVSRAPSVAPAAVADTQRAAIQLGTAIRDERLRRGWSLRRLANRAEVSVARVHSAESGRPASLEMYARLGHALGLRLGVDFVDPRRRKGDSRRDEDLVHAAMGELEAAHFRALGFDVAIDEPYQHYQFAGRADVVAWSSSDRALLHIENRTRFPNLQEAAGSYSAKRAYLGQVLAERLGIRAGFRSETHVVVGLWSAEILHTVRLRPATFQTLCPDTIQVFEAWWRGRPPKEGRSSAFVLLDPFAAGRTRPFVGLETVVGSLRPRVRDYWEAARRLGSRRV
jgi:transcriptional regulator with XRE-family HTH domain